MRFAGSSRRAGILLLGSVVSLAASASFQRVWYEPSLSIEVNELGRCFDAQEPGCLHPLGLSPVLVSWQRPDAGGSDVASIQLRRGLDSVRTHSDNCDHSAVWSASGDARRDL
jgi:hypothetical protein